MSRGISDGELIDEIQRLAGELGHTPSSTEMNELGEYSASACQNHFGTWNNALREAGFESNHERSDAPTKDALLNDLSDLAERLGRTPKMEDMDELGAHSSKVYSTRFDSWNDALAQSGLDTNRDVGLSRDDLLSDLREFASEFGKTPTRREMNEEGPHSPRPYTDRFGSWNEAISEAGLDINHASHKRDEPISRAELLSELERLADELGRPPTGPEMHAQGEFSHSIYQRIFDSWNDALREAGFELHDNKGTPNDVLLGDIRSLVDELGRIPAAQDMNEEGRFMHSTYQSRFGSWSDAVREAGYEPVWGESGFPSGEHHPDWKGGHEQYYGPSWSQQRNKRIKKDDHQCRNCGISDEEHSRKRGYGLHVHHITPFRKFGVENHEEANRLENLITLCHECHIMYEGTGLKPDTDE